MDKKYPSIRKIGRKMPKTLIVDPQRKPVIAMLDSPEGLKQDIATLL